MRPIIWLGVPVVLVAILAAVLALYRNSRIQLSKSSKNLHVVLIGASIGQSWHLAEWPSRTRTPGFTAESIAAWQFDKTEATEEVLLRPAVKFRPNRTYLKSLLQPPRPPDIVILKECSSYFPGDLPAYKESVRSWVRRLQDRRLKVVLATVVPVTKSRAAQEPRKQEMLLDYNRWLREYATKQTLPLVDLEAALRTETEGSYLREDFAAPDGSHLNPSAYAVLDRTLSAVLCAVTPPSVCRTAPARTATPLP